MKTFLIKTLVLLTSMTLTSTLAFAQQQGNSSGGGDGDRAFALQKLAATYPGMSIPEALLQAFKDSASNVPPHLKLQPRASQDSLYQNYYGVLDIGTGQAYGAEFTLTTDQGKNHMPDSVKINNLNFHEEVAQFGAALGDQQMSKTTFENVGIGGFSTDGDVLTNGSSLVLRTIDRAGKDYNWVELRSFDANTVIFIVHPGTNQMDCTSVHGSIWKADYNSGACSVGIFWSK